MTVKERIAILETLDPEAELVVYNDSEFSIFHPVVPVTGIDTDTFTKHEGKESYIICG